MYSQIKAPAAFSQQKLCARFKVIYLKSFMGGTDRVLFGLISVETKT